MHSLHGRTRVHARPSVAAVDVAARRDAALTHAATEGRLPQCLEPPVPPGGELHVQDATLEEKKHTLLMFPTHSLSEATHQLFVYFLLVFVFVWRSKTLQSRTRFTRASDVQRKHLCRRAHFNYFGACSICHLMQQQQQFFFLFLYLL